MYQNQFLKNMIKRRMKISLTLLISFFFLEKIGYSLTNDSYLGNSYEDNDNSMEKVENVGNGITFNEKSNELFINDGIIKGNVDISSQNFSDIYTSGNGVELNNNIKNIENNGMALGNIISKNNILTAVDQSSFTFPYLEASGNAINNFTNESQITSIKNNGLLFGKVIVEINQFDINGISDPGSIYYLSTSGNGINNSNIIVKNLQEMIYEDLGPAKIQEINNTGVISGKAVQVGGTSENITSAGQASLFSGNGINSSTLSKESKIEKISNVGKISGQVNMEAIKQIEDKISVRQNLIFSSGNAIITSRYSASGPPSDVKLAVIDVLKNNGLLEGQIAFKTKSSDNIMLDIISSGNGIYSEDLKDISNEGTISGQFQIIGTFKGTERLDKFASGIVSVNSIENLNNLGLIKGTENAISIGDINNSNSNNYGVLAAGKNIISDNNGNEVISVNHKNNGIEIKLSDDGHWSVEVDANDNIVIDSLSIAESKEALIDSKDNNGNIVQLKKYVINGSETGQITTSNTNLVGNKDVYVNSSNLDKSSDLIINGSGINKGALVVDVDTSLKDSIINGYETGLFIEGNNRFQGENVVINGGGIGKYTDNGTPDDISDDYLIYENVIQGDSGSNIVELTGNSIVNGSIDLDAGDNMLSISNDTQLNGSVNGGTGSKDILNIGEKIVAKNSSNLNLFHDINGFETINTNGNITLFETSKVTGANEINLESGNLVLRVDSSLTTDGKIVGHALYENKGTLSSTGGNLVVGLNGIGEDATISMGGTTITPETNDNWWEDTDYIKTNSLVLDGKLSSNGNDIYITILESLPTLPIDPPINPEPPVVVDSLLYEKLNKVYQSIVTAGEIGNLANTTLLEDKTYDESLGGLLTMLDQIYANNPYAYTLKSSRDSLKLFEDNLSYLTVKPQQGEMIVQGKAIYTGVKNDSSASGKNYHGFDTGHRNYKTTTNTVGGLATFEYGLSDDTSVGFVFGGNNQDVKFKGSSKIKGNSLYLGTFAKTDIKNFKFMSGVGYQYTSADADRKVSNRYDSFSTGDKYDINSLNIFVEAKYVYNVEQDWTVEPKVRLSYYYIDQDKVNEGYTPGQISMRTDSVNSNTADIEIGVDFVKSLYLNNGKLKNILSLGVINTIGDKSKELNGYILGKEKDGKKFDIQGVELPKTSGKVSYNLELEQTNGMIYTAGVSLEFAKNYNRNVNATVGIGYKF